MIYIHANKTIYVVSSTVIDFSIQCVQPPALFKVEATLLCRLFDKFIQTSAEGIFLTPLL